MHQYTLLVKEPSDAENETATSGIQRRQNVSQPTWKSTAAVVALCLSLIAFNGWLFLPSYQTLNEDAPETAAFSETGKHFSWHDIEATSELTYHRCYDDYQCAKLLVPMDWWRPSGSSGKNVSIAIIRLPAKVPVTDPRYGGAVLTNPGGPGGSGIAQVLRNGKATQTILDADLGPKGSPDNHQSLYFDIISFDPRGIARTTPGIQCFPDALARSTWTLQNEALGLLGSSEDSFYRNWYRSRALAEGCSIAAGTTADGTEAIGEHVNTSPVARDMLEIVERHAEWLSKRGQIAQKQHDQLYGVDENATIAKRLRYVRGEAKLKYWGNSYGTIIGQTFASMFPDRIGRMILDGVCNAPDYFFGSWFSNLADADRILERFFEYCAGAGPDKCSFYSAGGPSEIRKIYEELLEDIFDRPRVVPSSATRGPDVITWSDVKSMVRLGMYQPLIYSEMVADLLASLHTGNGSLFADFKALDLNAITCPSPECKSEGPFSDECNEGRNGADATLAVLCTDGPGLGDIDEEQFQKYWHTLQEQSSVLGDWWAHTRLGCVGWKAKAKNRFEGPFAGNLSHPILFVGNTLDPVTPLANAKEMAANFPGSVVLQQNSEGHTSWSSPSLCTAKLARRYMQTGRLPAQGSICEVDAKPFVGSTSKMEMLTLEDLKLAEAIKVVGETYMDLSFGARGPLGF